MFFILSHICHIYPYLLPTLFPTFFPPECTQLWHLHMREGSCHNWNSVGCKVRFSSSSTP